MQKKIQRWINLYARRSNQHRVWKKIVQTMACIVVFCTTYALILPAITMEQRYSCGLEAHAHTAECYEQTLLAEVNCSEEQLDIHRHTQECYDADGRQLCGYGDFVLHTHDSVCYDSQGNLVCPLTEIPQHIHSDGCYEGDGAVCGMQQLQAHTHTAECRDENGSLVCGKPEIYSHQHYDSCIVYQIQQGDLICGLEEHIHDASCVSDPDADVETAEQWAAMAAQLELTDSWTENLLKLSRSQLGYGESALNYQGEDEFSRKGYTRYGAWYGAPYGDWDAMFVSFCLHYAGIPREAIPYASDSAAWMAELQTMGLLSEPDVCTPQPGELVFFETYNGTAVRSGVLYGADTETDPDTGENRIARYRVIAGDSENRVAEVAVPADELLAACVMAAARERYEALYPQDIILDENETEPDVLTEPTETTAPAEPAEETQPTEPAERSTVIEEQVETENYIVTVVYSSSLELPEGAQLRVVEYAKDSDIFRQRCQEAGYELSWLLNIGFFLDEEELALSGEFDVMVTSKQGDSLGNEITHFTDEGTEQLIGVDASNGVEEGQTAVTFVADGFSDFGGIAAAAEEGSGSTGSSALLSSAASEEAATSYNFVTVNPANLQEGVDYVVYYRIGNNSDDFTFLGADAALTARSAWNTGYWSSPSIIGNSWSVSASTMGTTSFSSITWRVEKTGNQYYLVSRQTGQRLSVTTGGVSLMQSGTALTNVGNGSGAYIYGSAYLRYNSGWLAASNQSAATTFYFAQATKYPNYPHAVHTGEVSISRLRFYNLCENGASGIAPLAGCVFEVKGENGYTATITSGDSAEVMLPSDIPDGNYTITEVSVPDGYVRDAQYERTFTVADGMLVSDKNIGTFINHNTDQLEAGKTAEVADYNNRIYRILLEAQSNMKLYQLGPIDVLFVVDQSNSMLFPSGLAETGKQVTLRTDGTNNVSNLENLNLDKSKMHYVISDPTGTSTVWCVWHDGTSWMYQDASYYAKIKHENGEGYQTPGELAIFPTNDTYANQPTTSNGQNARSNGGGMGYSLSGSGLGKYIDSLGGSGTFTIYTSTDEYNRLHYLEEALANMIYELADANSKNRVTLTEFTKEVNEADDCFGPLELTPDNVEILIGEVQHINTSGGTRQDIALKHVYENHLSQESQNYNDPEFTYTILVTDGAPVRSSGSNLSNVGSPDDPASITADSIYAQIKGYANLVKQESTLMTVSLGMENVEGGKKVLSEISSGSKYYCALDDAAQLVREMQKLLFESFREMGVIDFQGDIVDEISDSFYPIAWTDTGAVTDRKVLTRENGKDWILLQENDWITLDGKYTTAGASDAAGQLLKKDDGTYYIRWINQPVSGGSGWDGTFYVKAKEDFIGGNAIDTNKSARVTVNNSDKTLETPTVNVRLLDMNQMNSEVTVYLGDLVNSADSSPLDSLKYFFDNTRFTKLISDGGDVLNKIASASSDTDGLEEAVFYLRYAMGRDLTEDEWNRLAAGESITVEYTYDYSSSHGPVGYFTFRLEKTGMAGANPSYGVHEATAVCQPNGQPLTENCDAPAETYTLHVTYTAYELGQNGRPEKNVHNDIQGPGTEVGTGFTLATGLGVVDKDNVHEVHVISGKIEITKKFEDGLTDGEDRTFTFILHQTEDGEDTSRDVTKTITIPAGESQGASTITFDSLRRGTYTVTEAVDESYTVKDIAVLDTTNCYSTLNEHGTVVTFVMGNNTENANVIRTAEGDRYTSYIDPVNGVYGAAVFTNKEIVYYGEIPVEKIWDDGTEIHKDHAVYLVLYEAGVPLVDGNGNARLLRLDDSNNWQGVFTVVLLDEDDSVENYDFSVREVSTVNSAPLNGWYPAILENDGETILYYDKALEQDGIIAVSGMGYVVKYEKTENGVWAVTNRRYVELPSTGGMGTHLYTFSGLLVVIAGLMYGYNQRRKRERGAEQ